VGRTRRHCPTFPRPTASPIGVPRRRACPLPRLPISESVPATIWTRRPIGRPLSVPRSRTSSAPRCTVFAVSLQPAQDLPSSIGVREPWHARSSLLTPALPPVAPRPSVRQPQPAITCGFVGVADVPPAASWSTAIGRIRAGDALHWPRRGSRRPVSPISAAQVRAERRRCGHPRLDDQRSGFRSAGPSRGSWFEVQWPQLPRVLSPPASTPCHSEQSSGGPALGRLWPIRRDAPDRHGSEPLPGTPARTPNGTSTAHPPGTSPRGTRRRLRAPMKITGVFSHRGSPSYSMPPSPSARRGGAATSSPARAGNIASRQWGLRRGRAMGRPPFRHPHDQRQTLALAAEQCIGCEPRL